MKKILMTFVAVLCCTMISTLFTSCQKNESISDYAAYTVNPSGTFSGNCLAICEEMRDALTTGMPLDNRIGKRNDGKAISICDEVYKKSSATAHFRIVLEVTPLGNGLNNTTSTIKTYEF